MPLTPTHKVQGKVFDNLGVPKDRKVCVFSKTSDQLLGSTVSDSITGDYTVEIASADPVYVVCFPNVDEDMNAKIYDRVLPVAI